jgi:hypothetical protein
VSPLRTTIYGSVRADRLGLMADALVGPVAIPPVGAGHVLGDSGRPMRAQAAATAGDPFAAMKDLDCRGGDGATARGRRSFELGRRSIAFK